ncbi:hypothetical protein [Herbaspirillum sp. YR522]|uniref:hypothetical protein n=1 Tax=Herbaspirillum sp. YR522 TaxID=1144342 RepID=UPI0012F9740C|nr:hypothetical protein [Herbaspirillum sp. YR522]
MNSVKHLKATAFYFSCLLSLSGCTAMVRTNQVDAEAAKPVPTDRLIAYQINNPGDVVLEVTRDEGFMGGGCFIALEIEGVLAGRFDPEETATFYVPSITPKLRVIPDPYGRGLCGIGWSPVDEHYDLRPAGRNAYRISLGAYRRPRLLPSSR